MSRELKADCQQAGNDRRDLERAEREAKEKLMAKRKLQALDTKKEPPADPQVNDSEDESQENSHEAEPGELDEKTTAPDAPKPSANQPSNEDQNENKDKKDGKRKLSKAEKRARKRKRGQQDQGGQKSKKKKTGKGRSKQDRSPPSDRKRL